MVELGVTEYDVIVVGGGPAGSSAARAAAEKGAKTIILERCEAIGLPVESSALVHATPFTEAIMGTIPERIILQRPKYWRFYAPSGKLLKKAARGHQGEATVLREEFDRELARQAIRAGAAIVLNTNVEELLKQGGRIRGVATNSKAMPQVLGKVVIAAGGNPSRQTGITKQEGMNRPEETFWPGIIWDLVGVRDADAEALETIYSTDVRRNWTTLWPRGGDRFTMVTNTVEQLEHIKKGKFLLAHKLRNAYPLCMHEYVSGNMGGQPLPKGMVRDGLILAGDAAGYEGMAHAIVSGRWAGEVAAEAIKEGNVSMERLSAYEEMCKEQLPHVNLMASIYRGGLATMAKVRELSSDEEIEREVTKMAENDEFLDGEQELPEL